jgi:tetratricopeptide (TPR) repeat protein
MAIAQWDYLIIMLSILSGIFERLFSGSKKGLIPPTPLDKGLIPPTPLDKGGFNDGLLSPISLEQGGFVGERVFVEANEQVIRELLTFLDFANEKLALSFIEINFEPDKRLLLEILQNHPDCQNIEFLILEFADPQLRFLQDELITQLKAFIPDPQKKAVVMLLGLEHSIGMTGSYPPVLQDLNFIRDSLINTVPHPLLLVLPDYSLTRVAKYAPDFWAWRYMVFRFKTTAQVKEQAIDQTSQNRNLVESYSLPEKQDRIDLLERLLMEYRPSGEVLSEENRIPYIQVLLDLGICYRSHGVWDKAQGLLNEALLLTENQEKLENWQASIAHELAWIYNDQGEKETAIALYQQSLEITEKIGDVQGQAATLHQLAGIYANQGEIDQAIALYQQSIEITEKIEDVQTKAATLHCLAMIYANQGDIDQAIALYQQSIEITEKIGDVQTKAATLHCLAMIYANQGEIDQAIALYQQSLEIKEKIGNVQGKAATLHQLAIIYANQGEIDQAIALYQQSLEIKEKIGNVQGKAATLHQLAGIYADQGEIDQAIALFQQVLETDEKTGNVQGKATTLHQLAGIYANQGKINQAIALFQQSLEIQEKIGDVQGKAMTLWWLGTIANGQGNSEQALIYLQESFEILQRLRSPDAAQVQEIIARIRG